MRKTISAFTSLTAAYHAAFVSFIVLHPILLIPLAVAYALLTWLLGLISILLSFGFGYVLFGQGNQNLPIVVQLIFSFSFAVFFTSVWLHYLFLAFHCFTSAAALRGYVAPVFRVIQLIAAVVFIFAVLHYYVALFSDNLAYEGLHKPAPERGWSPGEGLIDRLIFIPQGETVIDCIYFSTVTMATVGYGDIRPVSMIAKAVTVIQIICSFCLIVLVLGWVVSHAKDYET